MAATKKKNSRNPRNVRGHFLDGSFGWWCPCHVLVMPRAFKEIDYPIIRKRTFSSNIHNGGAAATAKGPSPTAIMITIISGGRPTWTNQLGPPASNQIISKQLLFKRHDRTSIRATPSGSPAGARPGQTHPRKRKWF